MGVIVILIRFRSAKLRDLVSLAVEQKFGQKVTGSGHLGIICPSCGEMTVFSGTQKDTTGFKYLNQETRLRNHGLKVPGKKGKGCRMSTVNPGTFVLTEEVYQDRKVKAVSGDIRALKTEAIRLMGVNGNAGKVVWVDPERETQYRFQAGKGHLQMFHDGQECPFRIQWFTPLG